MVKITIKDTPKGREGAPSRAVDSIDCTRMNTTKATGKDGQRQRPLPKMSQHSSGQARVRLSGKTHYLGQWGSSEAHEAFGKLLREWEQNGKQPLGPRLPHAGQVTFTVRELREQYEAWIDSTGRYHKRGEPTSQRRTTARALSLFDEFAGAIPVRRLGESLLMQWRDRLEAQFPKWVRVSVNKTLKRVLRMLEWGRARGLVTKETWADCALLRPLRCGECGSRPERGRRKRAVSVDDVMRTAAHCCEQVAAMMRLQQLTGMRPGEVVKMRPADIDKNGPNGTWIYTVGGAKTEHHGYVTRYSIGPEAQKILAQFPATPTAYIFSVAKHRADRAARLNCPPDRNTTRRQFRTQWSAPVYREHVVAACAKAGVAPFTPHEIRHWAITEANKRAGLTAASAIANHRSIRTTAEYIHRTESESVSAAAVLDQAVTAG